MFNMHVIRVVNNYFLLFILLLFYFTSLTTGLIICDWLEGLVTPLSQAAMAGSHTMSSPLNIAWIFRHKKGGL